MADGFDLRHVRGRQFSGPVRIGRISDMSLVKNDLAIKDAGRRMLMRAGEGPCLRLHGLEARGMFSL